MDYRRGVDFRDALEDAGFEFVERLHSDMLLEGTGHFAK